MAAIRRVATGKVCRLAPLDGNFGGSGVEPLPSLKDILAHANSAMETELFYEPVIDVEKVRRWLGDNVIRTGLIEFPIRKKYTYLALFAVVFIMAMTAFDYSSGDLAESIFLAIGAFSAGSLFALIAPIFWTKKRYLANENHL